MWICKYILGSLFACLLYCEVFLQPFCVTYTCIHTYTHSQFQQEYQTFYHKSFRVSDYLSKDGARLRDLLEACEGIKVGSDYVNFQVTYRYLLITSCFSAERSSTPQCESGCSCVRGDRGEWVWSRDGEKCCVVPGDVVVPMVIVTKPRSCVGLCGILL